MGKYEEVRIPIGIAVLTFPDKKVVVQTARSYHVRVRCKVRHDAAAAAVNLRHSKRKPPVPGIIRTKRITRRRSYVPCAPGAGSAVLAKRRTGIEARGKQACYSILAQSAHREQAARHQLRQET